MFCVIKAAVSGVYRGHVIRLDPTVKQVEALARAAGVARFTYNWALVEWQRQYKAGDKPTVFKLKKQFNAVKRERFPWIYESPKDANQRAFADLGVAFKNFFDSCTGKRKGRRVGYPTFRRRGIDDSFYVSNDRFSMNGNTVRLPVIGNIRMHEMVRWYGRILSGRVYRHADRWFLAVNVETRDEREPSVQCREILGVDLGIKHAATLSTGETIDGPRPLKKALKQLHHASRVMARRVKGGANRNKARMKVASIHQHVANIRKDFWHKLTNRLCRENQAVVIEDLSMGFMLRNRCLARAASDVALGMFRPMMQYKAEAYGTTIVVAEKFFPSTQRCSVCGDVKNRDARLALGESIFECEACHVVKDRDVNAAINLEQYPRLAGNWDRKVRTPMDDHASIRLTASRTSKIAEVGTRP